MGPRDRHKLTLASSKRRLRHVHRLSFANVVCVRKNDAKLDLLATPLDTPPTRPASPFVTNHDSQFRVSQKGFLPFVTAKKATSTNVSITTKGESEPEHEETETNGKQLMPAPAITSVTETPTPEIEFSRAPSSDSLNDELIEFHPPTAFFSIHDPKDKDTPIYVSPVFVHESNFGVDLDFDRSHRDLREIVVILWLEDGDDFRPQLHRVDLASLRYIGQDESAARKQSQLVLTLDDGCFVPGSPSAFLHQVSSSSGLRTPAEPLSATSLDQMLKVLNMEHLVKDAELTRQTISKEVETLTRNRELLTMAERTHNYTEAEIVRIRDAQAQLATSKFKLDQKKARLVQDIETRRAYLKSGGMLQEKAREALTDLPTDLPTQVEVEKRTLFDVRKQSLEQLSEIFPITHQNGSYAIAGLSLTSPDEHEQTFAYSLTCELLMLLSGLFEIPLKYPITRVGAHHAIFDPVSVITGSRAFPLFPSSLQYRFEYAVLLLNKDIQMILELLKIPIADGRETLGMLAILLAVNM
ncbi:hypothetical protein CJU89_0954 [Yarrowia sp. B02]|nr:hypothetical protein CJU89_0954 [Yarrowia sp. B02]